MTGILRRAQLLVMLAPVFFAAHIAEEAPGYVRWFNRVVAHGLGERGFLEANIAPLLITFLIAASAAWIDRLPIAYMMLAWLTHFMFANAIFHVLAAIVLRGYSPGTVTASLLYLPYFFWFVHHLRERYRASWDVIVLIVALVGLPMYLQTYMVVFRHSRYF